MRRTEQKRIAREILEGLKKSVLETSYKWPEHWDGFEIRQYVADLAGERYAIDPERWISGKTRLRDYKNARIVGNL